MVRARETVGWLLACSTLLAAMPGARPAAADCWRAQVDFTPVPELQIAIWLEDPQGGFVDTVFVTRATGSYGIGNRPGRQDFNSERLWPYGRRENVLPVWAHRRGVFYPRLVFQDGDEDDLSHGISHSSRESHFCRPLRHGEPVWEETIDANSCATSAYTDKGVLSLVEQSPYPPRNDLGALQPGDAADMLDFRDLNDLDAVSRATPRGFVPFSLLFALPPELPLGDYVLYLEASREQDFNHVYNPTSYPSPVGIPWNEYGVAWRGQPSVVYRVPVTVGVDGAVFSSADFVGYGDPDGLDGTLHPPDGTIDTAPGSYVVPATEVTPGRVVDTYGAARLELTPAPAGGDAYRLRVELQRIPDDTAPAAPPSALIDALHPRSANLVFTAPGDDGLDGAATRYEVRIAAGATMDEAGFAEAELVDVPLSPVAPGGSLAVPLAGLYPETRYTVGVRALDDCLNPGPVAFVSFVTPPAAGGEVDACFVATAAWGSLLATKVQPLRRFRDRILRGSALGELAVSAYYTFGPALAEVIEPSDTLRALARAALTPVVDSAAALVQDSRPEEEGPHAP